MHKSTNKGLRSNEQLFRSIFDNAQIAVEYSSFPILEDKKITGAVATVSDITERKRAKEALQASQRLFRSISSRTEQRVRSSMRKRCQRQSRTGRALLESSDGGAAKAFVALEATLAGIYDKPRLSASVRLSVSVILMPHGRN